MRDWARHLQPRVNRQGNRGRQACAHCVSERRNDAHEPGHGALSQGRPGTAAIDLEAIHAAHPSDLSAAILLAYTYNKLGRAAEAASLLGPLEAGHENNLELQYALAYALIRSGKQAEGLPRMEKVAARRNRPKPGSLPVLLDTIGEKCATARAILTLQSN